MPRKRIRKMRGGNNLAPLSVITDNESNRQAIIRNDVGEANIKAIHRLQTTKAPQAPGQLAQYKTPTSQPPPQPFVPIIGSNKDYQNYLTPVQKRSIAIDEGYSGYGMGRKRRYIRHRHRQLGGRMIGRPLTDRYGSYIYIPNLINS